MQCATTAAEAMELAVQALTGAEECDFGCEFGLVQCDRTVVVVPGAGGGSTCWPVAVPVGAPPVWCCAVGAGMGGVYTVTCDACP